MPGKIRGDHRVVPRERPDRSVDPDELTLFCEARLPYFAVPRYIDVLADLPRTENGKVQKYKLRERGVTPQTWDRRPAGRNSAKG